MLCDAEMLVIVIIIIIVIVIVIIKQEREREREIKRMETYPGQCTILNKARRSTTG